MPLQPQGSALARLACAAHLVLRVHVFRQSHSTCTRVLAVLTAGPAPAAGCAGQRLERNPGSFRTVALLDGCPFVLACWKVLLHLLACLPHHSRIRLVNQCRMQGSQHLRLKRTDPLQMIHEHEGLHEGLANISAHAYGAMMIAHHQSTPACGTLAVTLSLVETMSSGCMRGHIYCSCSPDVMRKSDYFWRQPSCHRATQVTVNSVSV